MLALVSSVSANCSVRKITGHTGESVYLIAADIKVLKVPKMGIGRKGCQANREDGVRDEIAYEGRIDRTGY
jgi:hypothetical protein